MSRPFVPSPAMPDLAGFPSIPFVTHLQKSALKMRHKISIRLCNPQKKRSLNQLQKKRAVAQRCVTRHPIWSPPCAYRPYYETNPIPISEHPSSPVTGNPPQ